MRVDLEQLARRLKPGDRVTTTLGREIVVAAVRHEERAGGSWWIEPEGADDFDWWLPVGNVVAVNGVPLPTLP